MEPTATVKITSSCSLVWDRYELVPGDVAIRYIEYSPDKCYSDSVTDADIDEATAKAIVDLLVQAFGPGVLPTTKDLP
jgi:hypothetical protein